MKQKDIFYIVLSSFIVIVIWIVANLWHIQNVSKLSDSVIMQTTPITPSFDTQTLQKLKTRSQTSPDFSIKNNASPSATPTPIPIVSPVPTTIITPPVTPSTTLTPAPSP